MFNISNHKKLDKKCNINFIDSEDEHDDETSMPIDEMNTC